LAFKVEVSVELHYYIEISDTTWCGHVNPPDFTDGGDPFKITKGIFICIIIVLPLEEFHSP